MRHGGKTASFGLAVLVGWVAVAYLGAQQVQHPGAQAQPAGGVAPHHAVRGQGRGQPVHDGAADAEPARGLGDGQAARRVRNVLEQPQPAVQRLRRLLHAKAEYAAWTRV